MSDDAVFSIWAFPFTPEEEREVRRFIDGLHRQVYEAKLARNAAEASLSREREARERAEEALRQIAASTSDAIGLRAIARAALAGSEGGDAT